MLSNQSTWFRIAFYFDTHLRVKAYAHELPGLASFISIQHRLGTWTQCDCMTCFNFGNLKAGLLQLCADLSTSFKVGTIPESHQCCWLLGRCGLEIMCHQLYMNFRYQFQREFSLNSAFWYIRQSMVELGQRLRSCFHLQTWRHFWACGRDCWNDVELIMACTFEFVFTFCRVRSNIRL